MFYHFLAPEGGHPTCEENSTENTRMQGPFFKKYRKDVPIQSLQYTS